MPTSPDSIFDAASRDYRRKYKVLATYVPELIAIHCGIRPALQISLGDEEDVEKFRELISDFCGRALLQWTYYRSKTGRKIIISREKTGMPRSGAGFGRLFGYPECCARIRRQDRPFDRLRDFWSGPRAPFETNLFLRTTPFHLIKHLPCAPDCAATLDGARKLLKEIDRIDAVLGGHIRTFGRLPAFDTDVCGIGILLQGRCDGERVRYGRHFYDFGPSRFIGRSRHNLPQDAAVFERIDGALSRGDELRLESRRLDVFRGGALIDSIERPHHLTWKILDFR